MAVDYGRALEFGVFVVPEAAALEEARAAVGGADRSRLDLVGIQARRSSEPDLDGLPDCVAVVLTDLADTARAEAIDAPGRPVTDQAGRRMTRIPAVLGRLRTAVALLDALGGPELPARASLPAKLAGHPQRRR